MNILNIIDDFSTEPSLRISYCYLHGQIQDDAGYDCFGIQGLPNTDITANGYLKPGTIPDGIYDCVYKDKPCVFFYWNSNDKMGRHRGLVVYSNDAVAYDYAKECYEKKEQCL